MYLDNKVFKHVYTAFVTFLSVLDVFLYFNAHPSQICLQTSVMLFLTEAENKLFGGHSVLPAFRI